MEDELARLERKKRDLIAQRQVEQDYHERERKKRALKAEIYRLENPKKVAIVQGLLGAGKRLLTPRPAPAANARKSKLKRRVATVADVDKAIRGFM